MKLFEQPTYMGILALPLIAASAFALPERSVSQEATPSEITAWYEALKVNDADTLQVLLADDATIELTDLGITQTKTEFIASLDQWAEANAGAELKTRLVGAQEADFEMEVCYRFASNEVLNLETYSLDSGKIRKSVQERLSDSCEDF
ncbi:MAG: nuclear transport factor 2 family protein [Salaquimonas sp.]